jgi:hypothetical protein
MGSTAGRRPRKPVTAAQLDDLIERLEVRIGKLQAIKAGMKQTQTKTVKISLETALEAIGTINNICHEGLEHLRKLAPIGERPWDEWDD